MAKDKSDGCVAVTYKPSDPTERNVITWNHVEFQANVPVTLDPERHFIVIDQALQIALSDGTPATRTRPTKVSMIEIAKGNPDFQVEGFPRAKRIKPIGRVPQPGAEWEGTDRDELIRQMAQVKDFNPDVGAVVVSG